MRSRVRVTLGGGIAALAAIGTLLGTSLSACSGEEYLGRQDILCPDADLFKELVSPYMERRCATLDCHGAQARPLRLYTRFGQRHPAESNISGGNPTTEIELEANYAAVCGLEPEKMAEALSDLGQSAEELLLVSKPRDIVAHKGGAVILEGDSADLCIIAWIRQDPREEIERHCIPALEKVQ